MKSIIKYITYPVLKRIKRFKEIHKGESCYLFGDGLSIKYFDLNKFSDKIAIPCGFLLFHDDYDVLQTPYALLIETYYFYPLARVQFLDNKTPSKKIILNSIQKEYRKKIKEKKNTEFFINLSNFPVFLDKNITYLFRDIPDTSLDSNHISRKFNCYKGSLRAQILIAIYMGFDHVYLVGHDYTHSPARSHHWYEKGHGVITPMPNFSKEFLSYASKYIDITTITADNVSDNVNYIKYQDFTGENLSFRENTELIRPKYLDTLATFPAYNIY